MFLPSFLFWGRRLVLSTDACEKGLIGDNSDSIAYLILDEADLDPWKPEQSGNPSGRPRGTRDLARYVVETTDGGKELVYDLVFIARGFMPNVPVQEGSRPR